MRPFDIDPAAFAEDHHDEELPQSLSHGSRGLALAIAGAALAAGVLTFLILDGHGPLIANSPQDCVAVADADARLTCYDESVHRDASQPARGALAPAGAR